MNTIELFSLSSVNIAEPWITKGIVDGLSATESLRQYRNGGGAIRDSYWYAAFKELRPIVEKSLEVNALPDAYTVPDRLYSPTGQDYTKQYIYKSEIDVLDGNGVIKGTFGLTVESSEVISIREWRAHASEMIRDYILQAGGEVYNLKQELWLQKVA